MKKLFFALIALTVSLGFTSCKKDENTHPQNYYTYDGKTTELNYGSIHHGDEETTFWLFGEENNYDKNYIFLVFPTEQIGKLQKIGHMTIQYSEIHPILLEVYDSNGDFHEKFTYQMYEYKLDNEWNQWVKVVKNNGENNYTVEFRIRSNGKIMIGRYSGTFDDEQPK